MNVNRKPGCLEGVQWVPVEFQHCARLCNDYDLKRTTSSGCYLKICDELDYWVGLDAIVSFFFFFLLSNNRSQRDWFYTYSVCGKNIYTSPFISFTQVSSTNKERRHSKMGKRTASETRLLRLKCWSHHLMAVKSGRLTDWTSLSLRSFICEIKDNGKKKNKNWKQEPVVLPGCEGNGAWCY